MSSSADSRGGMNSSSRGASIPVAIADQDPMIQAGSAATTDGDADNEDQNADDTGLTLDEVPVWTDLDLGQIYDVLVMKSHPQCWRKRLLNGTKGIKRYGDVMNCSWCTSNACAI